MFNIKLQLTLSMVSTGVVNIWLQIIQCNIQYNFCQDH